MNEWPDWSDRCDHLLEQGHHHHHRNAPLSHWSHNNNNNNKNECHSNIIVDKLQGCSASVTGSQQGASRISIIGFIKMMMTLNNHTSVTRAYIGPTLYSQNPVQWSSNYNAVSTEYLTNGQIIFKCVESAICQLYCLICSFYIMLIF